MLMSTVLIQVGAALLRPFQHFLSFHLPSFPFILILNLAYFGFTGAPQYVESSHGKLQLVVGGYYFYRCNVYRDKILWRCCMYDKQKCVARCHTINGQIAFLTNDHNHAPPVKPLQNIELLTLWLTREWSGPEKIINSYKICVFSVVDFVLCKYKRKTWKGKMIKSLKEGNSATPTWLMSVNIAGVEIAWWKDEI